jgi:hypothetical protein
VRKGGEDEVDPVERALAELLKRHVRIGRGKVRVDDPSGCPALLSPNSFAGANSGCAAMSRSSSPPT